MKHLLVFVALIVIDFAWSYYINHVKDGKAHSAASWSAFMMAAQGFAAINYVNDPKLLVSAIAGAWVGTYVGVWNQNRKQAKAEKENNERTDQADDEANSDANIGTQF